MEKLEAITGDFLRAANASIQEATPANSLQARIDYERVVQRRIDLARDKAVTLLYSEFQPLLSALDNLPEKDGRKFRIFNKHAYGTREGLFCISFEVNYGTELGPRKRMEFNLRPHDMNSPVAEENCVFMRERIGAWVGKEVPERLPELQRALDAQIKQERKKLRRSY